MKLLQEGDVIEIELGHKVYADVPEHFIYSNKRGCYDLARADVTVQGKFSYLAGRYIVIKTMMGGGGFSHDGDFPNGHHVFCMKSSGGSKSKIDFYQSGCFSAMITGEISVVGKAELRWEEIE